ncbi:MAG: radical SAM family heme chaperone HemW [Woeseiaceae bacterium]|nr:radical SAM family heme chaperone HemW [Woeseiaceae bacterium]
MTLPLSLYVHLPWCVQKCPYCDFNSHAGGSAPQRQRYLEALLLDLGVEAERAASRELGSIFLGGGTPSLFAPQEIERLLEAVHAGFEVADDVEITMEANPGTVECGAPAGYRAAGVNRLSFGGQSFDDRLLKKIGRIHAGGDIVRAVSDARAAGFDNINIDLMHGLPGQGVAAALQDLSAATELGPAHISWYQLTLEPNTVFYARPPDDLPGEQVLAEIQERGQALLAERGYRQYEVSAYAREGRRCRHNLNYWSFGDYLAAGAGAHGKFSRAGAAYRYTKAANPLQYMTMLENGEAFAATVPIAATELTFEFMLNALRLTDGFSESVFCETTGLLPADLEHAMQAASAKGLVARSPDRGWRPTALGQRFLNDLQLEFLSDGPRQQRDRAHPAA